MKFCQAQTRTLQRKSFNIISKMIQARLRTKLLKAANSTRDKRADMQEPFSEPIQNLRKMDPVFPLCPFYPKTLCLWILTGLWVSLAATGDGCAWQGTTSL